MKKLFLFIALALPLLSCTGGNMSGDGVVAEEDSLCIDTVASLDDVTVPDTLEADSLALDSLF